MDLNTGNIYSIPEHPGENLNEENYCQFSLAVKDVPEVTKKVSSTSLPEKPCTFKEKDLNRQNSSIPTLIMTEVKDQETVTGYETIKRDINRLSVSLVEFSKLGLAPDIETLKNDKGKGVFAGMTSALITSEVKSKSYLEVQDCILHSNHEPEYEVLLSSNAISIADSDSESVSFNHDDQKKERKHSDNLVFVDLGEDDSKYQRAGDTDGSSFQRPRSRSMQWIQNTFQSVSNKFALDFRRPSDIAEERMHKSKEDLDMEDSESELPSTEVSTPTPGGRRFSENVIAKQKQRFPFVSRIGHLKDLWKDKNSVSKRQEEKDIDQTRTDVCPLFTFPRKRDENELILDTLRQAMRKCTALDPSSRPTSTTVLDQLSNLINET